MSINKKAINKKLMLRLGFEKVTQLLILMAQFHGQDVFGKPERCIITCQLVASIAKFSNAIRRLRMSRIKNIL